MCTEQFKELCIMEAEYIDTYSDLNVKLIIKQNTCSEVHVYHCANQGSRKENPPSK